MRATWLSVMVMLAACGGGGELADETQRRNAEQALDTSATDSARARADTGYRVPAFVDAVPAAEVAPDTLGLPDAAPAWTSTSRRPWTACDGSRTWQTTSISTRWRLPSKR